MSIMLYLIGGGLLILAVASASQDDGYSRESLLFFVASLAFLIGAAFI